MLRLQAFKYELRPDGQQERQMRRFAGARRFVFNKALALQKLLFDAGSRNSTMPRCARNLPAGVTVSRRHG
jgi:putative transposase